MAAKHVGQFVKDWQALIALLAIGGGGSLALPAVVRNTGSPAEQIIAAQRDHDDKQDARIEKLGDQVHQLVTAQAVTNQRLGDLIEAVRRK